MLRVSSMKPASLHRVLSTLSTVEGATHPPLDERTFAQFYASDILPKHSVRPALICPQERAGALGGPLLPSTTEKYLQWNFEEFDRAVKGCARGLLGMGVQKGDRVGVVMGNNSAYAILQWACARIGAILTTVNPAYRINEMTSVLNLVGVKHLIVVPRIRTSAYVEELVKKYPSMRSSLPGEIQEEGLPSLRNLIVVDNEEAHRTELERLEMKSLIDWREVFSWREDDAGAEERLRIVEEGITSDDVVNIQFTSGTTGMPKAVSLTHRNLLNNGLFIGRCMHLTNKDVLCNIPPLFHCLGLVIGNLAAWVHGSAIVYPSPIFDPPSIVDAVVEHKCTAMHGVPTHFLGVLKEIEKRREMGEDVDTSTLRTGVAAGSSIPIKLMQRLSKEMGLNDLTIAYGMTETSPVTFQTTPEDPLQKRVETVGRVQPHIRAKVVDENGNIVPRGTPGELCVSGYALQKGYWRDEQQTAEAMKKDTNGVVWMHTGDQVIVDDEEYLSVVGRIKDIVIRGGENIFPVQIENALTSHPGIYEAAVVAVPDEIYGEVVGAWIVRTAGNAIDAQAVRMVVHNKMNPQNAPAWVWFADELPKTASGKVMKHVLRTQSKELAKKEVGRVITL
ncbi:acetyl-CoA synthetase-like protein [Cylindrobasidium torrendii FP15055 ss-10]|uniref:Acetyl-CoA synthetase-like protein n=1 Tax=Cylindrobasidium torrendii FP15055 ss-10 TaxID=1314674 RepID=A0A0D7BKP0_9AGAR|nr:acetyl-CoA synthetase-like protein [Cylindrobasidium torrendii FP15055 ss-10]